MKRFILALAVLATLSFAAAPAMASHGHSRRGHVHRHGHIHRHVPVRSFSPYYGGCRTPYYRSSFYGGYPYYRSFGIHTGYGSFHFGF